uniref:Uncharacterized protein n=1 Tax=Rhizophora mucronata TaxID=61149 RepID=A0A2P2QP44_RHIMU
MVFYGLDVLMVLESIFCNKLQTCMLGIVQSLNHFPHLGCLC